MDDSFNFGSSVKLVIAERYEQILNSLYVANIIRYYQILEKIKSDGYRVYRNSVGKHKVIIA